jgi:hypothetical protein
MSCDDSRPDGGIKHVASALLAAVALLALTASALAKATTDNPFFALPKSYLSERVGAVTWVYPASVTSEVRALQKILPAAWNQVNYEVGAGISSELTVRVGINPEQMQKLAPPHVKLPEYATGVALPAEGLILLTLTAPDNWEPVGLETVLTHELSHVALYRAVAGNKVPRWFSEGLAISQADERSFARIRTLWEGSVQGRIIPLESLSDAFPARDFQVNLAYAQSADFVVFLREGQDNLRRFYSLIDYLRKGTTFERAVFSAYHVPVGYLEREWRFSLQRRFGRLPLLLTGVGTIWVLASVLLFTAYIKTKRKHAAILDRWEKEEAEASRIAQLTQSARLSHSAPPIPVELQQPKPDTSGIPTIQYDGRNHTLH